MDARHLAQANLVHLVSSQVSRGVPAQALGIERIATVKFPYAVGVRGVRGLGLQFGDQAPVGGLHHIAQRGAGLAQQAPLPGGVDSQGVHLALEVSPYGGILTTVIKRRACDDVA